MFDRREYIHCQIWSYKRTQERTDTQLLVKWLGRATAWDEAGTAGKRAGSVLVGLVDSWLFELLTVFGGVSARFVVHASPTY